MITDEEVKPERGRGKNPSSGGGGGVKWKNKDEEKVTDQWSVGGGNGTRKSDEVFRLNTGGTGQGRKVKGLQEEKVEEVKDWE